MQSDAGNDFGGRDGKTSEGIDTGQHKVHGKG